MNTYTDDYFGNIRKERKEIFKYRLFDERYILGLSDLYGAVIEDDSTITEKNSSSIENHEKFFSYLLPLLEQGKLKVKIRDLKFEPATEEQKREHGMKLSPNFRNVILVKDHIDFSPEEAINEIRKRWNAITDEADRFPFETEVVLFTLPENDWAM